MTETSPPWGTPPDPSPDSPYRRLPVDPVFAVVVEQQVGTGQSMTWQVDPPPALLGRGETREQARSAALELARTFAPHHPIAPQSRTVIRLTPDSYLVTVEGMTRTFHFRVSVGEVVG